MRLQHNAAARLTLPALLALAATVPALSASAEEPAALAQAPAAPEKAAPSSLAAPVPALALDLSDEKRLLDVLKADRDLYERADSAISRRDSGKVLVLVGVAATVVSAAYFWSSATLDMFDRANCRSGQKCGNGSATAYSALGVLGGVSLTVGGGILWRTGSQRLNGVASDWEARHTRPQ